MSRAYYNAIVAEQARGFIESYMDVLAKCNQARCSSWSSRTAYNRLPR